MKLNRSPFVAMLALVLGAVLVLPASLVRAAEEKKAETELAKKMEEINKALKAIKKGVKDSAKNADAVKLAETAEKAAVACKDLPPAMLEKTPEAKKAEVVAGYKKAMDGVIADLGKLKQQLKDGKNEDAAETLKKLKELEDDGHEKYNP